AGARKGPAGGGAAGAGAPPPPGPPGRPAPNQAPPLIAEVVAAPGAAACRAAAARQAPGQPLPRLEAVERDYIVTVLRHTNGVLTGPRGAATVLGLNPSTLRSRIQKLGISRDLA